jgi:hypothetical protein
LLQTTTNGNGINMSEQPQPNQRTRRWGRIREAVDGGPLSRAELYELAAEHEGLFRKRGAATIVDLDFYDQILSKLPAAKLKGSAA